MLLPTIAPPESLTVLNANKVETILTPQDELYTEYLDVILKLNIIQKLGVLDATSKSENKNGFLDGERKPSISSASKSIQKIQSTCEGLIINHQHENESSFDTDPQILREFYNQQDIIAIQKMLLKDIRYRRILHCMMHGKPPGNTVIGRSQEFQHTLLRHKEYMNVFTLTPFWLNRDMLCQPKVYSVHPSKLINPALRHAISFVKHIL